MLKKQFYYPILFSLFLFSAVWGEPLQLTIGAQHAILMNARNGMVLFEKDAYETAFPASTTKIATAIYSLTRCQSIEQIMIAKQESIASISPQAKRDSNYRSPPHWLETDGSHIGIKKGEEFLFFDLLSAVLIASANDASNVIAQNLGGTIPKFMDELNLFLKKIGCKNTNFMNPHGLHHPSHTTTAYDLALMARHGLKDPLFRQIVSTARYVCPETNLESERTFLQTNMLLRPGPYAYSKAIGVKTGTTQAAGKSLVAAAENRERALIAVVLGYRGTREELYKDVIKIFESAFNEPMKRRSLLSSGVQTITTEIKGAKKGLKTFLPEDLVYDFYPSEEVPLKAKVIWELPPLPIVKGARVGTICLMDDQNRVLQETPLLAFEQLDPSLYCQLRMFCKESLWKVLIMGMGGVGLLLLILSVGRSLQRRPRTR